MVGGSKGEGLPGPCVDDIRGEFDRGRALGCMHVFQKANGAVKRGKGPVKVDNVPKEL